MFRLRGSVIHSFLLVGLVVGGESLIMSPKAVGQSASEEEIREWCARGRVDALVICGASAAIVVWTGAGWPALIVPCGVVPLLAEYRCQERLWDKRREPEFDERRRQGPRESVTELPPVLRESVAKQRPVLRESVTRQRSVLRESVTKQRGNRRRGGGPGL